MTEGRGKVVAVPAEMREKVQSNDQGYHTGRSQESPKGHISVQPLLRLRSISGGGRSGDFVHKFADQQKVIEMLTVATALTTPVRSSELHKPRITLYFWKSNTT